MSSTASPISNATSTEPAAPRPQLGRRAALRMALLALSQFLIAVDFDIVMVALPSIGRDLAFSPQTLQWVVSAYTVATGGLLLFGGRAADRLGAHRVFVAGMALFGVASLAGGLAGDPVVLIVARAVQGLGGALLTPAVLRLINTSFTAGRQRTRAFTIWSMAGSSGAAVGALGGGLLTAYLGWEWVLFVNLPVVVLAVAAGPFLLDADVPVGPRRGFDVPGAVLATVGATLLVLGLVSGPESGWRTPQGAGAVTAGLVFLALFAVAERRSTAPLMPPALLRTRGLVLAMAVMFVFMGVIGTEYYLFTTYLQDVLGYRTLQAGLAFLPLSTVSMVAAAKISPALIGRYGPRATVTAGMTSLALSLALLAVVIHTGGSYVALLAMMVLWGLGGGLTFPPLFMTAGADVAAESQGVAGAMVSTAQFIGGAVILAVLVSVSNAGVDLSAETAAVTAPGLRNAAAAAALATLVGIAAARFMRPPRPGPAETAPAS